MMAIKAGDHDKGIFLSGPVACIEVEDSPLEVATPTPKVSTGPETPDMSGEKTRNPLAPCRSFSEIRRRLKCWQYMKKAAGRSECEVPEEGSADEMEDMWPEIPEGGGMFIGGRYLSKNPRVMDPYIFEEEDFSMLNGFHEEEDVEDEEMTSSENEMVCPETKDGRWAELNALALVPYDPKANAPAFPHCPPFILRNSDQRRLRGKQPPKGGKKVKKDKKDKTEKSVQLVPKEEQKAIMETLAYKKKCSYKCLWMQSESV